MKIRNLRNTILARKDFAYSILDQLFVVCITLVMNIILARILNKEEYGTFALSYSVFTFIQGIQNGLILEAYTIFLSGKYSKSADSYIRFMFSLQAIVATCMALCLLMITILLNYYYENFNLKYLIGVAIAMPTLLSANFIRKTYYSQGQILKATFQSAVVMVVVIVIMIMIYATENINGLTIFTAIAIGNAVAIIPFIVERVTVKVDNKFLKENSKYFSEHFNYTKWVLLTAFVFQMSNQAYIWLSAAFMGAESVADLRAAQILVAPLEQLFIVISMLTLPTLAKIPKNDLQENNRKLIIKLCLVVFSIGLIYLLFMSLTAKYFLTYIFGKTYKDAGWIVIIVIVSSTIIGVAGCFNDGLKAKLQTKSIFVAYAASAATTLFIGIPLIALFGVDGVMAGIILSSIIYAVTMFTKYQILNQNKI